MSNPLLQQPPATTLGPISSTPTSSPIAARSRRNRRGPIELMSVTTPQWLRIGLYTICGLSGLGLGLSLASIQSQRTALTALSQETMPSILTTLRLRDSLASLDASLANELLLPPGQNLEATQSIQERQIKIANYQISLSGKFKDGNPERRLITRLQIDMGNYLMAAQRARGWNSQGNKTELLKAYREAERLLDRQLMPAAEALGQLKSARLESIYRNYQRQAGIDQAGLLITALVLMGSLGTLQLFLSYRTRRTLNPALLAATTIALLFWLQLFWSINQSNQRIAAIKTDSFAAVRVLRESRTLAYSAHADISRSLLDREESSRHDRNFNDRLLKLTGSKSPRSITVDQGLLGQIYPQLSTSEKPIFQSTLTNLMDYWSIREQVQDWAEAGKQAQVIALATGYQNNQLNGAFESVLDLDNKLITSSIADLDQSVSDATKNLAGFDWKTPIAFGLVAALTIIGLRPRIQAYER
jgi:hypothetical protein